LPYRLKSTNNQGMFLLFTGRLPVIVSTG